MPEIAAVPEIAAAAEGGTEAGGLGGMLKDFNDLPVGNMAGSIGGKMLHTITGAIGTPQGHTEQENIGPMGHA